MTSTRRGTSFWQSRKSRKRDCSKCKLKLKIDFLISRVLMLWKSRYRIYVELFAQEWMKILFLMLCRIVNEGQELVMLAFSGEVLMKRCKSWGSQDFPMQIFMRRITKKTDLRNQKHRPPSSTSFGDLTQNTPATTPKKLLTKTLLRTLYKMGLAQFQSSL
jgi:hypothetical protein